jgi:transposase-like protein
MSETRRHHFTAEYKAESVRFCEESRRSLQSVAGELGVHADHLRSWRNDILAAGTAEALAKQKAEAAKLAR